MLGRGNHHPVNIFERQQILRMLEGTGCFAIIFLIVGHSPLEIVSPHITYSRDLDVFLVFEVSHNPIKLRTAIADADVAERDPIVRPNNPRVGKRCAAHGRTSRGNRRALLKEFSPVKLAVGTVHSYLSVS